MRELLVQDEDGEFILEIPEDAKVTFGPWSPPGMSGGTYKSGTPYERAGTLRIYKGAKSTDNVMGVFSGVKGFRDLSLGYDRLGTAAASFKPTTTALGKPAITEKVAWEDLDEIDKEELVEMLSAKVLDKATGTKKKP